MRPPLPAQVVPHTQAANSFFWTTWHPRSAALFYKGSAVYPLLTTTWHVTCMQDGLQFLEKQRPSKVVQSSQPSDPHASAGRLASGICRLRARPARTQVFGSFSGCGQCYQRGPVGLLCHTHNMQAHICPPVLQARSVSSWKAECPYWIRCSGLGHDFHGESLLALQGSPWASMPGIETAKEHR